MAGRIQASELFPGAQLRATALLWAEASHWACDALNRTATTANPERKYGMWRGSPPPGSSSTFPKAWLLKVKRENKSQAKAQGCFYLGPAPNYRRLCASADSTPYCASHAKCHLATRIACTPCACPGE